MIWTGVKNQFLTKGPESALNFFALAETLLGQLGQYESQMYKESLTETSSQSVVVAVDRISTGTPSWTSLCQVSIEELAVTPHTRLDNFYNSFFLKVAN